MLKNLSEVFDRMDRTIFFLVLLLLLSGIIFVYSSSFAAGTLYGDSPYYFTVRQFFFVLVSIPVLLFFMQFDYQRLKKLVKPLMFLSIGLLLLVFIPGVGLESGGARRWINLRVFAFNPSELAKLVIIIYLSFIMTKKQAKLSNFTFGFLPPLLLVCMVFFIILMQSGFSTAALLLLVALIVFFVGGASLQHILVISAASIPVLVVFIRMVAYRKARILSFLDPWSDASGRGYHLIQSLKSFANGGFIGTGLGNSVQKMGNLPTPHTDFIYAVIAEELGLFGALVLIAMYIFLFIRGIMVARRCQDRFGQLLAFGITALMTVHAVMNMGIATGILPPTGVSLPFVSYGGSSMLVMAAGAGILLNISSRCESANAPAAREIDSLIQEGF